MKRALIAAALWASSAYGDALHATREQPLLEVSHTVDITLEHGVATYKVRRVFANPGTIPDEAGLAIDLPYGAAATGLRIRAHSTWYDGELMERDKAAALYHELTGLGAYRPKDPALLQWIWADKLYLQIFPVMPGTVSTVEYTLTVPTRYAGGRYWLSYPRVDSGGSESGDRDGKTHVLATPVLTVHASGAMVDGHPVAADTPVVLTPPVHEAWMEDPSASYVSSTLVTQSHGVFTKAKLAIDLRHTYKSDLQVQLLTPEGQTVDVFDRNGGSANDITGTFELALPAGTHGAGTWRLVVSDHAALDTGTLDAWSLQLGTEHVDATGLPVFIPDAPESGADAGVASIAIAPPHIDTWIARLGKVVASAEHSFARLEVDVAPEVRPLPKHAQIVFALDASYSIGEEGLAAELALVRAYLAHVPDADVELVAYRRHAGRVFGSFIPARKIDAALARHPIKLGNGSAIDEGARLAASLLAARTGPRRLVIASDELLRTSLADPAAGLAALPADVVVHVVHPILDHDDKLDLVRDDKDRLAPLATHHHGIFGELHGLPAPSVAKLAPAVLELVRPTRIDQLAVAGVEVADTELREGTSLRVMVDVKRAPSRVVLTGKLWSDPVRREVDVGATFSRQTAAFVFGEGGFDSLSKAEMMKVAQLGRAVSPVTSYVAFEPGTRPSPIGIAMEGRGLGGGEGHGYGDGAGMLGSRMPPDLQSMVDVEACVTKVHPAAGWRAALDVETTKDEVVDVAGASDPMTTCLAEAVWALRLGPEFDRDREAFHLEFR
jgi:subtilisin-like proprotein convertase family protein